MQFVQLKDIIYFESSRNEITIHTNKGEETFYDTLADVWHKLKDTNHFIMPHRSYIFNLRYITLRSNKILLKQRNEVFNIGDRYKADTEERYLKYIEMRCR